MRAVARTSDVFLFRYSLKSSAPYFMLCKLLLYSSRRSPIILNAVASPVAFAFAVTRIYAHTTAKCLSKLTNKCLSDDINFSAAAHNAAYSALARPLSPNVNDKSVQTEYISSHGLSEFS